VRVTRPPTAGTTFFFAELDASAELWETGSGEIALVLDRFVETVVDAVRSGGGHVHARHGGAVAAVFEHPEDAAATAGAARRALGDVARSGATQPLARIGVAGGEAYLSAGSYVGPGPIRAARFSAAAHGGQVLVDTRTASALDPAELLDLGVHRLVDLPRAERVFQLDLGGGAVRFPVPNTLPAVPGNVPLPRSTLVGRHAQLSDVVELVRGHRLVTLCGVGGVGKTRLAIEVAASLAAEVPDGVWMIGLASLHDADSVPHAMATTLGLNPPSDVALIDWLADALGDRRMLIVVDNCEHVVDTVARMITGLLERTTNVRFLCTSREALDVAGEQRRLVAPLALAGGAASPAVALFVERACAHDAAVDLEEPRTAEAVVEICERLDGLPLGIELAAARTVSMSPVELRDRLADRLDLLSATRGPRRQQTLRSTVAWSYDLLGDGERVVLRTASVFQGGFELGAMMAVVGAGDEPALIDVVDSLVRKSLVIADHGSGTSRFVLLETIRQFAEDELAAAGALEDTRARHAEFFAAEAVARLDTWNGPGWRDSVDWVETELANLRNAYRWARSRDRVDVAVDIAAHAGLLGWSVQLFECVGWAQELAAEIRTADLPHLPRLFTAAAFGCFTGRPVESIDHARTAQALEADPRYVPYEPGLAGAVEALAQVYSGHLDRYIEAAERVVAHGGRARAWGLPLLLDGLQASGRVDEALALTEAAMVEARAVGNPFHIGFAYWACGGAHAHRDPDRALAVWREGLDYLHQHRVDWFVGFIARDAARLRLADADPDDALTMFDESIGIFQQSGNVAQLTITIASVIALFERIARLDIAATLYAAMIRQPHSQEHVPELAEIAERLVSRVGETAFDAYDRAGAALDLDAAAHVARREVQRARADLRAAAATRNEHPGGLSAREVEVLRLAAAGLRTKDIAERLYISAKTVDRHIQNLYTKIGASNRAAATRWAAEHRLLDSP
jgi:predicted ATPase/DNA-binding CsgD family transcriptional regulator